MQPNSRKFFSMKYCNKLSSLGVNCLTKNCDCLNHAIKETKEDKLKET